MSSVYRGAAFEASLSRPAEARTLRLSCHTANVLVSGYTRPPGIERRVRVSEDYDPSDLDPRRTWFFQRPARTGGSSGGPCPGLSTCGPACCALRTPPEPEELALALEGDLWHRMVPTTDPTDDTLDCLSYSVRPGTVIDFPREIGDCPRSR